MDYSFFNTLFTLRHSAERGLITEANAKLVLYGINSNRVGGAVLLELLTRFDAKSPLQVLWMISEVERTGRIPAADQKAPATFAQ